MPQAVLLAWFGSKQDALDGFLGAGYALHIVATVAVMADARDLCKAVGSGVYFYRLEGVKGIAPRKMVLLK